MHRSIASSIMLAVAVSLALSVAACGRKGDPYLPKGQQNTYPDQYPKSTQPQSGVFSGS